MLAFIDAVGGSGVRSPHANASLDGGDRTGGPQDLRFSIALPYLRSVPFRRLSCAGVCVNRDAWTPFLLAEQACVSRKRDLNGQPESLSDLPRYQGVVRVLLHALGHRGGCLQDRGRASRPTAAGVAGDGARGRGLPLRGSDRCVCRHLRPATVGHYGLHTDGVRFRVRGCHPRIHSRARRPGGVGCRVHVHQRGARGLDRGRRHRPRPGKGIPARRAGRLHRLLRRHPCERASRPRRVEPAAHRRRRPHHHARLRALPHDARAQLPTLPARGALLATPRGYHGAQRRAAACGSSAPGRFS